MLAFGLVKIYLEIVLTSPPILDKIFLVESDTIC